LLIGMSWEWSLQLTGAEFQSEVKNLAFTWAGDWLLMPATIFYIAVLPLSRSYFENGQNYQRNKPTWKKIMIGYNWLMCLFSVIIFALTSRSLLATKLYTNDCKLLWRDDVYAWCVKLFYWSKFFEYLDTFWLYVMNKPVTYLQWFHHIGAAYNMWGAVHFQSEASWIFVWLNSLIHTIMYCYYANTVNQDPNDKKSLKAKIIKIVKPFVTSIQIVQFVVGFTFLYQYRTIPCLLNNKQHMIGVYYFTWFYVGTVLLLFLNFYIRSYLFPSKRTDRENGERPHGKGKPLETPQEKAQDNPQDKNALDDGDADAQKEKPKHAKKEE